MASSDFLAKVGSSNFRGYLWLDIIGIRERYGSFTPSWSPEDSGTNRPIRPWFSQTKPQVSGQVVKPLDGKTEPSSASIAIIDKDSEITKLFSSADMSDGYTTVTTAITAGDGSIVVADTSGFSADMDIYIDRETLRVTEVTDGTHLAVTRGMYGSTDADHPLTDAQGNTRTLGVYSRPPQMYTREAVLYLNHEDDDEADAIVLIRGFIDEGTAEIRPGVWQLQIAGQLKRLKCKIGDTLAKTKLKVALTGYTNGPQTEDFITYWCAAVEDAAGFEDSGWIQIDNELIRYLEKSTCSIWVDSLDTLVFVDFGTDDPADSNPLIPFGNDNAGRRMLALDTWGLAPDEYAVARAFHNSGAEVQQVISHEAFTNQDPIGVFLEFLCSTGDGTNGDYDTLPEGWGAGIDESLIDISGIEAMRGYIQDVDLKFVINESEDLDEWLADNILRPCLLFPVENDDGTIGLQRLLSREEAADGDSYTIDESILHEPPRFDPGRPPMADFKININYYPPEDKFYGHIICVLGDGKRRFEDLAERFEADVKTLYDNTIKNTSWASEDMGGMPQYLQQMFAVLWDRYAIVPCPRVRIKALLPYLPYLKAGKVVQITCTMTPDLKNSDRGISSQYFQVMEEGINIEQGLCEPLLWQIGIHDANYKPIAPSAKVKAYEAEGAKGYPRITLYPDEFADLLGYTYDVDAFSAGDKIALLSGASGNYYGPIAGASVEIEEIKGRGSGPGADDCYVDLVAAPTNPPSDGDFVETAPYDDAVAAQQDAWAFLAGTDGEIGTDGDDGCRRL